MISQQDSKAGATASLTGPCDDSDSLSMVKVLLLLLFVRFRHASQAQELCLFAKDFNHADLVALRGGAEDTISSGRTSRLLRYWLDDDGIRVYTVKKLDPFGRPTFSAYPANFSPGTYVFGTCPSSK